MSAAFRPAIKRDSLNLRIKSDTRDLIDRAAHVLGKTRTDFVLDAARQAAEAALVEQTTLSVSPQAYAAFVALLEAAPQPNERLARTVQTPAPWE